MHKVWPIARPILIWLAGQIVISGLGIAVTGYFSSVWGQIVFIISTCFLAGIYAWTYRGKIGNCLKWLPCQVRTVNIISTVVVALIATGVALPFACMLSGEKMLTVDNISSPIVSDNQMSVNSSAYGVYDNMSFLYGSLNPTFVDESHIDPNQGLYLTVGGGYLYGFSNWKSLNYEESFTFTLENGAKFTIYPQNGRVYLDTEVYAGPYNPPIKIHGMSYVVTPPNWDENYDANKFEVVNQDGDPVFQVIYPYQFMIMVFGIFPGPKGVYWATPSGGMYHSEFDVYHLAPIFKYPSSKYPHQVRSDWKIEWERKK